MKLIIPGTLPGSNEIINASKKNKHVYVKMKDEAISRVFWSFRKDHGGAVATGKCDYAFTWYEPNMKRDKDNIIGGQKFVFDSLQLAGFIPNDGWKQVGKISHNFAVDKQNPRVEVEITTALDRGKNLESTAQNRT